MALDNAGSIYIGDYTGDLYVIRQGKATKIETIFVKIGGIALDTASNIYYSAESALFEISSAGIVSNRYTGDFLAGVSADGSGNVYVADSDFNTIVKVSTQGTARIVAGTTPADFSQGFSGDGGPATMAMLSEPTSVAVDAAGNIYIADSGNNRVRKVDQSGVITTIAGTGGIFYTGDGGPATAAGLQNPTAVAVGPNGLVYVSDTGHAVVRLLTPTGTATAPSISGGIAPVYATKPIIQQGEWVSIYGTDLSASTVTWNGDFPTSLGGTSVTIDGRQAYLSYVSPVQINLQAPADANIGPVPVVVTTASGTASSTVTLAPLAPSFSLLDSKHAAGIILRPSGSGAYGGGAYDILGPTGTSLGYQTVAAKAGDTIELFGVGFGPTSPTEPPGQSFVGAAQTIDALSLTINNVPVFPEFVGLTSPGLYQINLTLPAGLGVGDQALVATVAGSATQTGVVVSLQ
jgi:uncharacterized protein (TIGR03437 family)